MLSDIKKNAEYVKFRALAVPQIFGTRSVPRSLLKKGTRSVLRSNLEKRNAFRSSFLRKGTVVPFSFLNKKSPKLLTRICSINLLKTVNNFSCFFTEHVWYLFS